MFYPSNDIPLMTPYDMLDLCENKIYQSVMSQFGKKRLSDFYVDPTYVNVNHASYGYVPKVVMEEKKKWLEVCQFNTEKWFRGDVEVLINEARTYVASRINCKPDNLFFVENATDGINCILKSFNWTQNDVVLIPNTAYSCVRKTVTSLQERYNITILDIKFTQKDLQSPQKIQLCVEDFVNAYPKKIKCAIFDHIVSTPGVVMPIETLQAFFEEKNIPLFVDGAHAVNQLRLDMHALNPAAYFSNFHKWAFAPKNAAFLYISDYFLNTIRPVLTGNFHGEGPAREFFWTGTRDYTSYLCVKKGLEYSDSFGFGSVATYNHELAMTAAKRIAEIWKTSVLTLDERCVGSLQNVEVPISDPNLASTIAMQMLHKSNCFPAFFQFDGKIWVRISAQLYNEISDYEYMANTFLSYLKSHQQGTKEQGKMIV